MVVGAVLVAGTGAVVWARNQPGQERLCSVTGAADSPIGSTPAAAFAAWFARSGPADAVTMAMGAPAKVSPPTIHDFHRRSSTEWEWRYARTGSVGVDVAHTDVTAGVADGWTVSGVNECVLGHEDLQGPSTGG